MHTRRLAVVTAIVIVCTLLTGVGASTAATTGSVVDETIDTRCVNLTGEPVGELTVRITFSAPAELTTGETFTLSDLAVVFPGGGAPAIRAEGTDAGFISPSTEMTVTADAGGTVTIYLRNYILSVTRPYINCWPIGDTGHLASIPVVAP